MGFFSKLFKPESVSTFAIKPIKYSSDGNLVGLSATEEKTIEFTISYLNTLLSTYDKEINERPTAILSQKKDPQFILKSNVEYCMFLWPELRRAMRINKVPDIIAYAVTLSFYANAQYLLDAEIKESGYSNIVDLMENRHDLYASIMNSKNINYSLRERYSPLLLRIPITYASTDLSEPPKGIFVGGLDHVADCKWVELYLSITPGMFNENFKKGIDFCCK